MKLLNKKYVGKPSTKEDINVLENILGERIPLNFKEFLLEFANCSIKENLYPKNNQLYIVNDFLPICNGDINIVDLTSEFIGTYGRKYIPFAFDPGGWHFCLCLDETDYNTVFINRWTDDFDDGQFLKIADSFDSFIDGLLTEKEAVEMGYKK